MTKIKRHITTCLLVVPYTIHMKARQINHSHACSIVHAQYA